MIYTSREQRIAKLKELVEHFKYNLDAYRNKGYKEAKVRIDFLDPFFEIFDWDVRNENRDSEDYRDVITEDSLEVSGSKRAPDYCFKIGKERKFYVEAKKPSVDISQEAEPALQVRRYGYTAGLPVSILTDFQKFAVYDTTKRPHKSDKASTARIRILDFTEYVDNFDYLYDTFSKTAVRRGSFDKYAKDNKNKRGTESIDKGLLALVEELRLVLAKNVAKNNSLDKYELNDAVIKILDRIMFLRIAEDKAVEPYETLLRAAESSNAYNKIKEIFKEANARYNSELFKPSKTIDGLIIDDKVLKDILTSLYYPECPYEFSVLPVSILGNIYEQFLGQTIRLTDSGLVKIEEKPEVRKAGGVYYTPEYIVDYIVKNTLGEKIKDLTPKEIEKIKVLDPACGSGSFLIGAYQYLLDYHLEYYTDEKNIKKAIKEERIAANPKGGYRLTIPEKQNILKNNIFGVDIDAQAVEVSKFSLLIKLMETETELTTNELFNISKVEGRKDAKILPNLEANIKCGNSLIGKDFLKDNLFTDNEELIKINPFDWDGPEGFPEIMRGGGFDCVIGNPPYVPSTDEASNTYFETRYKFQDYQKDLYLLFLEKYSALLKDAGVFGVIISNTWLLSLTYKKIRHYLTSRFKWKKIVYLPERVFHAVVDTTVIVFEKNQTEKNYVFDVDTIKCGATSLLHCMEASAIPHDGTPINIIASPARRKLFDKITAKSKPLSQYCDVYNGVKPFEKGKGTPPQTEKIAKEHPYVFQGNKPANDWSPLLRGSLINRYINLWDNNYWIQYGPWLAAPRNPEIFKAPEKIVVRQTGDSIIAAYIGKDIICRDNLHVVINNSNFDLRFFLALLNSRLLNFYYEIINPEKGEALAQVKKKHAEQLPVPSMSVSNRTEKDKHDAIVNLVEAMLEVKQKMRTAKTETDKKIYQQKAGIIDQQIDALVYELYSLTPEEIKLIENC